MTEPLAHKIGVANLETVSNQTNYVTITEGEKTQLVYSSPLPNRSLFQGRKTELEDNTFAKIRVQKKFGKITSP